MKKLIHIRYGKHPIYLKEFTLKKIQLKKFQLAALYRNFILSITYGYVYSYIYYVILFFIKNLVYAIPSNNIGIVNSKIEEELKESLNRFDKIFERTHLDVLRRNASIEYFIKTSTKKLETYLQNRDEIPHPFDLLLDPIPLIHKQFTNSLIKFLIEFFLKKIAIALNQQNDFLLRNTEIRNFELELSNITNKVLNYVITADTLRELTERCANLPIILNKQMYKYLAKSNKLNAILDKLKDKSYNMYIARLSKDIWNTPGVGLKLQDSNDIKIAKDYIEDLESRFPIFFKNFHNNYHTNLSQIAKKHFITYLKIINKKYPILFNSFVDSHKNAVVKLLDLVDQYYDLELKHIKANFKEKLKLAKYYGILFLKQLRQAMVNNNYTMSEFEEVLNIRFLNHFKSGFLQKVSNYVKYLFDFEDYKGYIPELIIKFLSNEINNNIINDNDKMKIIKLRAIFNVFYKPYLVDNFNEIKAYLDEIDKKANDIQIRLNKKNKKIQNIQNNQNNNQNDQNNDQNNDKNNNDSQLDEL